MNSDGSRRNIQSSKSKSNNDGNITGQGVHKYVAQQSKSRRHDERVDPSKEKAKLSQISNEEHPVITAKRKSMNLTLVVQSKHPQVNEPQALPNSAVKNSRKVSKPHESIPYSSTTREYSSRKPTQPRSSRPQIPDAWGQEPTGPRKHERTVVGSTSRDHPYTPAKKETLITRNKKIRKETVKLQKNIESTTGVGSTYLTAKVRISPEEEFNKLNESITNKTHQGETTSSCAGETPFIRDARVDTRNYEIRSNVSRDLTVDKSTLLVRNVSQNHTDTPNGRFFLQVNFEPSSEEMTKIPKSLQRMPLCKEEFEPKPGSSKIPDPLVLSRLESSDSLNNSNEVTESTKLSEMCDVECSGSNAFHEDDAIISEPVHFSLQYSNATSRNNSRVVPFAYARIEDLEKGSRNLSDQLTSSQNEDKVILDEASSSSRQVIMLSKSRQDIAEKLPTSVASSSLIKGSSPESLKISPNHSDLSSITTSAMSIESSDLPSFLPASATPVPQKIISVNQLGVTRKMQFSKLDPTDTDKQAEGVQAVIGINASKIRQEIANLVITSMPSLALKLNSLKNENTYISREIIRQLSDILDSFSLHFFIPIRPIPLYISSNKQSKKQFSLSKLLYRFLDQVNGTFGLNLFSIIRIFFWFSESEIANGVANLEGYGTVIIDRDIILSIYFLMEELINPIMQINKNNRFMLLSLTDSRCEIILPNLAYFNDIQIRSVQFFEKVVPLSDVIWMKAFQVSVPCYKFLKNSVCQILQTAKSRSLVLIIPQLLGISRVTSNELRPIVPIFQEKSKPCILETGNVLIGAELHIFGIMLPLKLTQKIFDPLNAPTNMVEEH